MNFNEQWFFSPGRKIEKFIHWKFEELFSRLAENWNWIIYGRKSCWFIIEKKLSTWTGGEYFPLEKIVLKYFWQCQKQKKSVTLKHDDLKESTQKCLERKKTADKLWCTKTFARKMKISFSRKANRKYDKKIAPLAGWNFWENIFRLSRMLE